MRVLKYQMANKELFIYYNLRRLGASICLNIRTDSATADKPLSKADEPTANYWEFTVFACYLSAFIHSFVIEFEFYLQVKKL